jgi:hypothetical protein
LISICFEAVDFSLRSETDELIKKLDGKPPMLIIAEALADMMGDLDEDKAKHITQVFTNLRRVEKKTGSVILVLHHQGWNNDRERGSTAIRANNDVMVQIVKDGFKPDEGYIKFTHLKRRGGPKLKEFAYEVKLVPVEGCEHAVPIVTGMTKDGAAFAADELNRDWKADEEGARQLVQIVMQWPDGGGKPAYTRLLKRSGMEASAFERARVEAVKVKTWLTGGGKTGYVLNPNGCWKEALASMPPESPSASPLIKGIDSPSTPSPLKGGEGEGRRISPSLKVNLKAIEGEGESSAVLPSEHAEEALALTLDTAALLKKIDGKIVE